MNDCESAPADEQDLEPALRVLPSAAQQDDRRREPRCRRGGIHDRDDNLPGVSTETETKQLWICSSCGLIYCLADGDPDGGIPPGTDFADVPDSWFCPVCGARKSDFEPYE